MSVGCIYKQEEHVITFYDLHYCAILSRRVRIRPRFILQNHGDPNYAVRAEGTTFSNKMNKETFNSETP